MCVCMLISSSLRPLSLAHAKLDPEQHRVDEGEEVDPHNLEHILDPQPVLGALVPALAHLKVQLWVVRYDAVEPLSDVPPHLALVVDGPRVHSPLLALCPADHGLAPRCHQYHLRHIEGYIGHGEKVRRNERREANVRDGKSGHIA
jgi:hypothetical protein